MAKSEPVEDRGREDLITEHLSPLSKGLVRGADLTPFLGAGLEQGIFSPTKPRDEKLAAE